MKQISNQMGNSTYIRDNGNWTHLQDPMTAEEIWKDGRNNQIKAMAETFNISQAELAGSENINGTDAYKLRIINGAAESDALYETAFSMAANLVSYPMFMPSVDSRAKAALENIQQNPSHLSWNRTVVRVSVTAPIGW